MKTNTELQIACAERMGYKLQPSRGILAEDAACYGGIPNTWHRKGRAKEPPPFPTCANAALTLIEEMRKRRFHFTCYSVNRELEPWVALFEAWDSEQTKFKAHADTLPHAICLAFLAAMEAAR